MEMNGKQHKSLEQVLWSSNKNDTQRHLAQMGRGILIGLRESRLTVEQAERDLFNMDVYQAARRQRLNPSLIQFLEWGMELEDVLEVAPDNIEESYREMDHLLISFLGRARKPHERKGQPSVATKMRGGTERRSSDRESKSR
jgi:hypothetical protein